MDEQPSPKVLGALWRYRWASVVIVLAVVLLSVAVALLTFDRSVSQARVVLKAPDKAGIVGVDAGSESAFVRYVNQRALFIVSDRVLGAASANLGGAQSVDTLRQQVTATASQNGESILVRVDGDSPESAAAAVDAVTKAYQDQSRADVQTSAQRTLDTLNARRQTVAGNGTDQKPSNADAAGAGQTISELDKQSTEVRVAADQFGDGVSFVDKGVPDGNGLVGTLLRDAAIGLALGILVAAAIAWTRADRDHRVLDSDDLAATTGGGPVLAEVEALDDAEVGALRTVGSPPLWPYQFAASGLRTAVDRGVVVVTATGSGDGSTTSTMQMATAAARSGARVLVVDAAVRSHGLSDLLGLRYDPHGLTSIAVGAMRPDDCTRVVDLGDRVYLWAVPAGQYQEATLDHFRSSLLQKAVSAMRGAYDLVLVDCTPPSVAPEVTPIITESDAVVVVVRRDRESRAVQRLRQQIGLLGGSITGYLFTFARPTRDAPRRVTTPPPAAAPGKAPGKVQGTAPAAPSQASGPAGSSGKAPHAASATQLSQGSRAQSAPQTPAVPQTSMVNQPTQPSMSPVQPGQPAGSSSRPGKSG